MMETVPDDHKRSGRGRLMGKLFGKDKRLETLQNTDDVVADFLQSPSDKLTFAAPEPSVQPQLKKIDTSAARRWPTAAEVNHKASNARGKSASPKRSKKGLIVRFTDRQPQIIGEGGDESEEPSVQISIKKRANTHPGTAQQQNPQNHPIAVQRLGDAAPKLPPPPADNFRPGPLRRTATGFSTISDAPDDESYNVPPLPSPIPPPHSRMLPIADESSPDSYQSPTDSSSFAAKIQAQMRADEGRAFARASRNMEVSPPSSPDAETFAHSIDEEVSPVMSKMSLESKQSMGSESRPSLGSESRPSLGSESKQSFGSESRQPLGSQRGRENSPLSASLTSGETPRQGSPASVPSAVSSAMSSAVSIAPPSQYPQHPQSSQPPQPFKKTSTFTLKDTALAVGNEAIKGFENRVSHMFTLFNLAAESRKPISAATFEELVTAGLWWLLKGRTALETTIRDRPNSPEAQRRSQYVRQQSHADLAKALWIVEHLVPRHPESGGPGAALDDVTNLARRNGDGKLADILGTLQSIQSNLKKLCISMQRNNLLPPPPGEAPLLQGLDNQIWAPYPDFTPDIVALLNGKGSLGNQNHTTLQLSECFPTGDTQEAFCYGRLFVDLYLQEDGMESDQFKCPCILSITRFHQEKSLRLIVASQNGLIKLAIQTDRNNGPTFDDLHWRPRSYTMDIKLPRGFLARIVCSPQDFQMIHNIFDYTTRTHDSLRPRKDEEVVYDTTVKAFQTFDRSPQSQGFSKEAIPACRVRLLERKDVVVSGMGAQSKHAGYRLVIISSPRTKSLSGASHDLLPTKPILFGFLRGDGGDPALLYKIDDGRHLSTMVFTFAHPDERLQLHSRIAGGSIMSTESILVSLPLKSLSLIPSSSPPMAASPLSAFTSQMVRVVNEIPPNNDIENTKTVLSPHLRIITDFSEGTLTDRINVGPGELKVQLDPRTLTSLRIFRLAQNDMTACVSEAQIPKDSPRILSDMLNTTASAETVRSFVFPDVNKLHQFQAALTGFSVLFDGLSSSFAISRRMMVVPIYKKWDASLTRLQIVQKEKVVQLLAFFDNFVHGDAMGFVLKGTDVFETINKKEWKYAVRIVDAKFALPRGGEEGGKGGGAKPEDGFLSLDMPEYPGEHDDITISFDSEAERDRFARALPAPTKAASRMGNLGSIKRS